MTISEKAGSGHRFFLAYQNQMEAGIFPRRRCDTCRLRCKGESNCRRQHPVGIPAKKQGGQSHLATTGRDDWIRTSDPVVPNDVRYRAALHPEEGCKYKIHPKKENEYFVERAYVFFKKPSVIPKRFFRMEACLPVALPGHQVFTIQV